MIATVIVLHPLIVLVKADYTDRNEKRGFASCLYIVVCFVLKCAVYKV